MTDCLDISLVANAGVLIRGRGACLLVDGMHHEGGHPFCMVGENALECMRRGAEPFDRLDYLLFTHEHPDHFTPELVLEHIRQRPVKGVFLPDGQGGSPNLALLLKELHERRIPHWPLGLEPGRTREIEVEEGVRVTAIGARHMGPQFKDVRNDCFLVSVGGMQLLFTGDADHVSAYFEDAVRNIPLDAVFVNPIFYYNPAGQAIINDLFCPREVVIYHMPPREDDLMHLHFTVKRALEKYACPGVRTRVLIDEASSFRICRDAGGPLTPRPGMFTAP